MLANEKSKGMGDQEEGMDLADEVDMGGKVSHFSTAHDILWRRSKIVPCESVFLHRCNVD